MRIVIGSDHAGRGLRAQVGEHLKKNGHIVEDLGTHSADSVDYPVYAKKVGEVVTSGKADLGVLVCGTGLGVCMAANKLSGVRAALCFNTFMAERARAHNDANILCLGELVTPADVAMPMVDAFIAGKFEGGRHAARVAQLSDLEKKI